ncbi:energy transducer TonB [Stenotrophomonas nitritireducens]|uniref:energy transducer TonB n=1 Tax=Stenotrophomonas nitritireducens TaxID=83617 RepID=UPI003D983E90
MSATHAHELHPAPDGQPRHATSPWLWAALALAILIGVLALVLRQNEPVPAAPVGNDAAPVVVSPTADAPPVTRTPAATTQNPRRQAPLVRDRQARPLAGNASPAYPPAALRAGVEGSVVASLQIDAQGKVTDASIVSRSGERSRDLDRAVLDAVRGWKFEPALRNGREVASVVRVPVDFHADR